MQNQVWDSQKTENLTKIDLETEFINGFSIFLMLRKAPIALSDLVSEPLPFNLEKPLELRGTFLELFFLMRRPILRPRPEIGSRVVTSVTSGTTKQIWS